MFWGFQFDIILLSYFPICFRGQKDDFNRFLHGHAGYEDDELDFTPQNGYVDEEMEEDDDGNQQK